MRGCDDMHRLLARAADEGAAEAPEPVEQAALEAHLAYCAECRTALAEQRRVAAILRSRPPVGPSAGFAARLATRLDEASGWFGILDWRAWTFRLAPVALALGLVALFAGRVSTTDMSTASLEAWTESVAEPLSEASAVWQGRASSEALLETMLTGTTSAQGEPTDVR